MDAEVLVVGGGPGGLSAAITLASEGRSVILFERQACVGGQLATTTMIENYLPFPGGISGEQFAKEAAKQCRKFGVDIRYNTGVQAITPNTNYPMLLTDQGYFRGRVVLLAPGLKHKSLNVPGSDLSGIHLGMNKFALPEVEGKRVAVIGGGNSVGQAACYYCSLGAHVTIITRRPIEEKMSQYLVERIASHANIVLDTITAFKQTNDDICIQLEHSDVIQVDCVHILIGQYPPTAWLGGQVWLDGQGYIIVDSDGRTSCPDVFAVGDVVSGSVKRAMCAAGRGVEVVPIIHQHLKNFACSFDK